MIPFATGKTFTLFSGHIHTLMFHHQLLLRTYHFCHFQFTHGQCKSSCDHPSASLSEDGAGVSLEPIFFESYHFQFYDTFWLIFHPLQPFWQPDIQLVWFLAMCLSLSGVIFKGQVPAFEMEISLTMLDGLRQESLKTATFWSIRTSSSIDESRNQCSQVADYTHPFQNLTNTAVVL